MSQRDWSCSHSLAENPVRSPYPSPPVADQQGERWGHGAAGAGPDGRPIDPRADYQEWKALLTAAGCATPGWTTRDNTAATMLPVLNVPSRMVMDLRAGLS